MSSPSALSATILAGIVVLSLLDSCENQDMDEECVLLRLMSFYFEPYRLDFEKTVDASEKKACSVALLRAISYEELAEVVQNVSTAVLVLSILDDDYVGRHVVQILFRHGMSQGVDPQRLIGIFVNQIVDGK